MDRPNAPGNLRLTPIQVATRFKRGESKGHTEAVKVLVGCTNTPNKALDMQGRTPIHYAMANGQHDVVKLLAPFVQAASTRGWLLPFCLLLEMEKKPDDYNSGGTEKV